MNKIHPKLRERAQAAGIRILMTPLPMGLDALYARGAEGAPPLIALDPRLGPEGAERAFGRCLAHHLAGGGNLLEEARQRRER